MVRVEEEPEDPTRPEQIRQLKYLIQWDILSHTMCALSHSTLSGITSPTAIGNGFDLRKPLRSRPIHTWREICIDLIAH
ncbi:protein of unknown function [Methylocaldum szegediense]|uniref:Uncharacterized protein n=1 Tax=Methylocaldum szegediense TaxID=73780 RepID=A0ABN8X3S9_9GAMM|nr:protein of unknown function [Methylocaldum szegediense]